jgi:hypothetical protein
LAAMHYCGIVNEAKSLLVIELLEISLLANNFSARLMCMHVNFPGDMSLLLSIVNVNVVEINLALSIRW